ncbi:hypothetical protein TRAPUB_13091 [Trametes pubescens]|uniref:Heterokaryon incompatibility domain-containing protein n=1 Tax=Trametes pubescens TaxID=154538 RepID=A0A1M2VS03_TRAPU|nr:hypothetical protein TRAPUB_13091 [Trametes pubescens]
MIDPCVLPPTIRDAIYVTRMLGFRWLWIDSLCIIQDSDEDMAHEIGCMHHIYRYAHLTIVAGSAEGVNSGDELGWTATRAWCMQEYLMSPRTLIFTPTTLRLRCLVDVQDIGNSFCSVFGDPQIPDTLFLRDPPVAEPGSKEWMSMHEAWMVVVEDYTRRTASVESDKLIACAALAEQFHRVLDSEYLAGLWRSDELLVGLLWAVDKQAQRLQWGLGGLSADEEGEVFRASLVGLADVHMDYAADELPGRMWIVPFVRKVGSAGDNWVQGIVLELAPLESQSDKTRFRRIGFFCNLCTGRSLSRLWSPIRALNLKDSESPWMDIVIV